jgi:hypothetical protein
MTADELDGAAERVRARLDTIIERVENARVHAAALNKREAARTLERADAARAGRLGPAWQRIQQRIDLDLVHVQDVLAGRDSSFESRSLMNNARDTLVHWGSHVRARATADLDGDAIAATRASGDAIAARLASLRRGAR